jgi:hypothetical protein
MSAEIIDLQRIIGDGYQNAFTDLAIWRDHTYLCYHAPVVLQHQGRLLVAGRSQEEDLPADGFVSYREQGDPSGHHTSVRQINGTSASHLLTVPSGHDCSYCGLASAVDGTILMSYYSQHERLPLPRDRPTLADVYLARFQL